MLGRFVLHKDKEERAEKKLRRGLQKEMAVWYRRATALGPQFAKYVRMPYLQRKTHATKQLQSWVATMKEQYDYMIRRQRGEEDEAAAAADRRRREREKKKYAHELGWWVIITAETFKGEEVEDEVGVVGDGGRTEHSRNNTLATPV